MSRSTQSSPLPVVAPERAPASPLESVLQELRVRKRGRSNMLSANFGSALEALRANLTRTLLTTLGIFIGVAAVIGALTLTQGASAFINGRIASLGTNTISLTSGVAVDRGVAQGAGTSRTLTSFDAQSLVKVPHVIGVSPVVTIPGVQVVFGRQNWNTQVEGVNTDLQNIQNWQMAQGYWFTPDDDTAGAPVALLGDTVAHNLFDATSTNPLGQSIRVRDQLFRVVGVLAAKGGGFNQDDVIFIPFHTALIRLTNQTTIDSIQVQVDDASNVDLAQRTITSIIEQNHHILKGSADDFQIRTSTQLLQRAQQSTQILTFLLVGIAAISLTVGGIGIMNIMLVSVTERTREIGIRMAIGARRADIRNQFLIEALALCLIGGIIGLLLGLLIGWTVTNTAGIPFVVTPVTLSLPVAVSVTIAIVFGLYPAVQAARLDPIESLRTDE